MDKPGEMTTLSMVMNKLKEKDKDAEFKMTKDGFKSTASDKIYQPDDLKIIRTYRFEGDSNPADMSILYVIKDKDGLIGYCLDAYGAYANYHEDGYDEFIAKVAVDEKKEEEIFN